MLPVTIFFCGTQEGDSRNTTLRSKFKLMTGNKKIELLYSSLEFTISKYLLKKNDLETNKNK